jgi:sarcosine oxidase
MKIAVVGLGAVGSQVLWQLSKVQGVELHGYEAGYPGHPFAGAGGESRIFRNFELESPGYMPIHIRSDELWRELDRESGRSHRRLVGVLNIGEEQNPQMQRLLSSAREWDRAHEVLSSAQIRDRFPQYSPRTQDIGIFDVHGGAISPELTVSTAAQLAEQNGANVHEYTRVSWLEESSERVRLHFADESVTDFDRVVVAGGGWTTKLVPELRDWIVTKRLTSIWYTGATENYLAGMPPFLQVAPAYSYGLPTADAKSVKIGLGFNDHLSTGDPDTVPRTLNHEDRLQEIEKFSWVLRDLLPGLNPNPLRIDTYIESYSRSMHEFIGPVTEDSNVIALTGFSGHGFEICPAIGEIGAQIAVTGKSGIDLQFMHEAEPVFEIIDIEAGTTTRNAVMASGNQR